jgi:hypothetical protein
MDCKETPVVEVIASPAAGAIFAVTANHYLPSLVFADLNTALLEKIAFNDDERASGKQAYVSKFTVLSCLILSCLI